MYTITGKNSRMPELLAPAGDFEKLKIALAYGADAVYIGGSRYGLRAMSKNFTIQEMLQAVNYAHKQGAKLYVTVNIFAHQEDFQQDSLVDYIKAVEQTGADALIISDPGVFSLVREVAPCMDIHISTQANITNARAALFWHKLGARRVILARELSKKEILEIRELLPEELELEAFVHGAMCVSYSGRCLLSSYMTGRDANRGECAQPCRWGYSLMESARPGEYLPVYEDERGTYIFNSRDLCLIEQLPDLLEAGVASFKIEGRMKTPYYVGAVVKAYREAIDDYMKNPAYYESRKAYYMEELQKTSHRLFTTGFFEEKPSGGGQVYENSHYIRNWDFVGMITDYDSETSFALIEQRNKILLGDEIEVLTQEGAGFVQAIEEMLDSEGRPIQSAPHAQQLIKIRMKSAVKPLDMIRKHNSEKTV